MFHAWLRTARTAQTQQQTAQTTVSALVRSTTADRYDISSTRATGMEDTDRHETVGQARLLVTNPTLRSNSCGIEWRGIGAGALGHFVERSHAVGPARCTHPYCYVAPPMDDGGG